AAFTLARRARSSASRRSRGVRELQGGPTVLPYNAGADPPEDVVYKMLVAFEKNKDRLASTDAGFAPLAQKFVQLQVDGINANPDIAVHAGLAKLLKERGAWDQRWKAAAGS